MQINRFSFILLASTLLLAACSPVIEELTASPMPSETPLASPTIDWFPATSTPTLAPTLPPSPTPDLQPGQGQLLLEDDFASSVDAWPSTVANRTRVSVENNRINLYTDIPGNLLLAPRNAPVFGDFYAQLTASSSLCNTDDEYGLMFRIASSGDHYRFALSCDGRAKVDRVLNGALSTQAEWLPSNAIPSVAPSIATLSVWASSSDVRLFVDDTLIFTINDTVIYSGRVGVFIRARGEGPVSVSFSDLTVYQVDN